jgi:hypothetical protein
MKLTTTIARNLEPPSGKTDHIEWDEDFPGFGVRVRVGRNRLSRMWVYQYDIAGRTRRVTVGNVNAISIQDARIVVNSINSGWNSVHRDSCARRAVQKPFQVKAGELIFRAFADMRGKCRQR